MITVSEFANGFSSIWRELTPSSQRVMRQLNLLVERYFDPLEGSSDPTRRGLINEIGFELSNEICNNAWPPSRFSPDGVSQTIFETIKDRLMTRKGSSGMDLSPLSDDENGEARDLCFRIVHYFANVLQSQPTFYPNFAGCGFLFPSQGDIKTATTLYEVKSGERKFRSPDLRQLLIYCASRFAFDGDVSEKIGLLNPRMGTYFIWDLRAVCFELGGLSPEELFEQLIYHISSGSISR